MKNFKKNKVIIIFIFTGVLTRLLFAYFYTNVFDFFNILVISKSVLITSSPNDGLEYLRDTLGIYIQLYGRLYYQVIAIWLFILEKLGLIQLESITKLQLTHSFQAVIIKSIQLIYDLFLLYFLCRITKVITLNKKTLYTVIFFWAINPYFIYTGYGAFQADLAMLAFFFGGIYFGLQLFSENKIQLGYKHLYMSLFFSLGAGVKLVPLLFIVPLYILFHKSLRTFIVNIFLFLVLFAIISQAWALDSILFNKFFFITKESTAILSVKFLGIPLFLICYLILVIGIITLKHKITRDIDILKIIIIIFSLIYIFEPSIFLFAHLNIWIMPFIVIGAFKISGLLYFLFVPVFGFYKWVVINKLITSKFFNFETKMIEFILISSINFFFVLSYIFLIYFLIGTFYKPNFRIKTINPYVFFISLFLLHVFFLLIYRYSPIKV